MSLVGERFVAADPDAVAEEGARRFVAAAKEAIAKRGRFTVALAGGSTPKAMYEKLARPPYAGAVDWPRVEIFFSDERSVAADHPESNYGMAARALLDHVPVDKKRVHRIEGERAGADRAYGVALEGVFGEGGVPVFDLVLLGMGADGHTASLFPHTDALDERQSWVRGNRVAQLSTIRYTFTPPLINAARQVIVTVCGAEKAPVLAAISDGAKDPQEHPVLLIRPSPGKLTWLLDRAAAG